MPARRPYVVRLNDRARRDLGALDAVTRERVTDRLRLLGSESPRTAVGVTALVGSDAYRQRTGDHRAIFLVDDHRREVLVTRVARRDEGTYR